MQIWEACPFGNNPLWFLSFLLSRRNTRVIQPFGKEGRIVEKRMKGSTKDMNEFSFFDSMRSNSKLTLSVKKQEKTNGAVEKV